MNLRLLLPLTSLVVLLACTGNKENLAPTIGGLESRTLVLEPSVSFPVDPQQVIDSYRELVLITPDGENYGEEVRRLADLELEASLDNKLSENPERIRQGELESSQAIQRYEEYLNLYPEREENDVILYQLSRAYSLQNDNDKARAVMIEVATKYPQSRYMDEIQFRLGEDFYVAGDYFRSEQAYGVVVNHYPNSIFYEKALYKYGWSQFKQDQYDRAILSYIQLLDFYRRRQKLDEISLSSTLTRAEKELLDDVLRVLSLSFSYRPSKQPINQFVTHHGKRDYEPLLYLKLGELYLAKERIIDAIDNFLSFGENHPFSRYTPDLHDLAINAYERAGYNAELLPQKERYVRTYNVGTAFWGQQDERSRGHLQPRLTRHISDIATHYHALARSSKKPPDYKRAALWYRLYLDSFPEDDNAANINFLLAESLFDGGEYDLAVNEYEKTAYQYPPHENSAEAAYAVLVTYQSLSKTSSEEENPIIIDHLIQSSLKFSEEFADDKRAPEVLLSTVEQLFALGSYSQALDTGQWLAINPSLDDRVRQQALILVAHSHFELAHYVEAEIAYIDALDNLPSGEKEQRSSLQEQLASSIYKQGEQARAKGQHQLAAEHFRRVGKVVPTSAKIIIADYDAATEYIALNDWDTAIKLLQAFRKKYPGHKQWQQGVSEKLALAYKNSEQNIEAADEIMLLVKMSDKSQHRDLLWQAAELYEQAGKPSRSIPIYKTYVKDYPHPLSRSIELREKIASYYSAQKDNSQYHHWLNEIVKADASGGQQRNSRSRYLAAKSSLELVKPLHQSFTRVKLTTPLKKSLKRKKKLMKQALSGYSRAAKYQVEEVTTAITFQIAEIYREFATSLLSSQRPKNLNTEELEEYNYLLEDQAYPFEEKAISIHASNLTRIQSGTYDESVKSSLQTLAAMMPYRYAKYEKIDQYVE